MANKLKVTITLILSLFLFFPNNTFANEYTSEVDFNQDGTVTIFDYNILIAGFGTKYDIFDYNQLIVNYGK